MSRFSAMLDACVLVPIAPADTLLRLAEAGLFRPLWSEAILDEVLVAIERVHPELADGRARRRVDQMRHAFPDALVLGWEPLTKALSLPDPNDVHVLAAAVRGRADVIVTSNLRDFPAESLNPLDLTAQSADDFLLNQLDLAPDATLMVLRDQAAAAGMPEMSIGELLTALERAGVPDFVRQARAQQWRLGSHWAR